MRTLIIALNSKYIHSALAPWYLKQACRNYPQDCGEVLISEYTINENQDSVLRSIYLMKPDITAFSCYIWNISQVLELATSLKKLLPSMEIILGGPEVSFDAHEILLNRPFIDYIIKGEGDIAFPKLISLLCNEKQRRCTDDISYEKAESEIEGLVYRSENRIVENEQAIIHDLDSLPSPYTDEMIASLKHKIVYFESSRGCPFSCSYCLSSVSAGVRYFSLQRVYDDLDKLVRSGIGQIKFVDRTFNANLERSKKIIRHILELNRSMADDNRAICNFHFEVGADLFDDETINLLNSAPKGLFQMEAGVQSINREALAAVCRKTDLDKIFSNIIKIRMSGKVHTHADLIAGLPFEDYCSFGKSFDAVYSIRPHQLQLGFLKLLKGTKLRAQSNDHGYIFLERAPYEILAGNYISYDDLIRLKGIAELVERYYNSGRFVFSLEFFIEKYFGSPFAFYESFYEYHCDNGYLDIPSSLRDQYRIFNSFYMKMMPAFENSDRTDEDVLFFGELLRLDFLASDNSGTLPDFMERRGDPLLKDKYTDFLRNTSLVNHIIPEAYGMTPKQILKDVHFELIRLNLLNSDVEGEISFRSFCLVKEANVFIFNYFYRDKVTSRYQFSPLI